MIKKVYDELIIYVIYDHPKDYPDKFVMKRDIIGGKSGVRRDPDFIELSDKLEDLRTIAYNHGLFRMRRHEMDDPCIIECWL